MKNIVSVNFSTRLLRFKLTQKRFHVRGNSLFIMHRSSIVNLFQTSPARDDEDGTNGDPDQAYGREEDEPAANEEEEVIVVSLTPKFSEQLHIFSAAQEMRNEAAFCDVSFVVKGNLFRAHKIIVRQVVK